MDKVCMACCCAGLPGAVMVLRYDVAREITPSLGGDGGNFGAMRRDARELPLLSASNFSSSASRARCNESSSSFRFLV
jgi:hypothetical protein